MKPFTIAFPLPVSKEDAPKFLLEKLNIDSSKKQIMLPGSSILFEPVLQGSSAGLEIIFAEHSKLTAEEKTAIAAHMSLFFLQFFIKTDAEFESFLNVAKKILDAGALGVYVENSGCAWSGKAFENLVSGDVPLEAFINFVETSDSMFTLGMEPFNAPDICIATKNDKLDLRAVLISAADSIVSDGADFSSGAKWKDDAGNEFEFRNESKPPFAKNAPEWNAQGYARLVAKTGKKRSLVAH